MMPTGCWHSRRGLRGTQDGDLFVADTWNDRVQKFSKDGAYLGQWGVSGPETVSSVRPSGIAVGASGNVYVADEMNNRIQVFTE